jgi:hypothetical protein
MSVDELVPKEKYLATQLAILDVGKSTHAIDTQWFLGHLANLKTQAPNIDPTLYAKAKVNIEAIEMLAQRVNEVKAAFQHVISVMALSHRNE